MAIVSFCPFSFALDVPFSVMTLGSPNSASGLPLLALSLLFWDVLIWLVFVAFCVEGLLFHSPFDHLYWCFCLYPMYSSRQVFLVYMVCVSQ